MEGYFRIWAIYKRGPKNTLICISLNTISTYKKLKLNLLLGTQNNRPSSHTH